MSNSEPRPTLRTGMEVLDRLLGFYGEGGGIYCPEGQSLLGVVFGEAGAGKSVFGMQLCCRWATAGGAVLDAHRTVSSAAVLVSHETPELVWNRMDRLFRQFVCTSDRSIRPLQYQSRLESILGGAGEGSLYILQFPLDTNEQAQFLENVIDTISDARRPEGAPAILLCLDNANAISDVAMRSAFMRRQRKGGPPPAAPDPGDIHALSRHSENFYNQLRYDIRDSRIHLFLLEEEEGLPGIRRSDRGDLAADTRSVPIRQAYAADIAIRLGVQRTAAGYKDRFIEILKVRNQYYHRGLHHFSIVSPQGGTRVGIEEPLATPRAERRGYGIVISPSVPTQLAWAARDAAGHEQVSPERLSLGIESLDTEIRNSLTPQAKRHYILKNTSSVLVSDLDSRATEIAIHFAARATRALFISFLHNATILEGMRSRFAETSHTKAGSAPDSRLVWRYFYPEHVGEGKLLHDIDEALLEVINETESKARVAPPGSDIRVVVDNIFELRSKYPVFSNHDAFIATLVELFSKRGVTSLLVDMVEAGEGHNPIENSKAAGLADNVFLLRHVEFPGGPRSVFSVQKLAGSGAPEAIWDLVEKEGESGSQFMALRTFDLYKNVLSGRPEPVSLAITLYDDGPGSPFRSYVEAHKRVLEGTLGCRIDLNLHGPKEYACIRGVLDMRPTIRRADCHIVAIDEFWMKDLINRNQLEDLSPYFREERPHDYDHDQYVTTALDMAIYLDPRKRQESAGSQPFYAVPARNNCGVLCCVPWLIDELKSRLALTEHGFADYDWQNRNGTYSLDWNCLLKAKDNWKAIREHIKDIVGCDGHHGRAFAHVAPQEFFTFCMDQMESCVSFFLELALSFAPREKLFAPSPHEVLGTGEMIRFDPATLVAPLCMLARLLDRNSLEHLAQRRLRSSQDEPSALFSRQWWSTMGCLRERTARVKGGRAEPDVDYIGILPHPARAALAPLGLSDTATSAAPSPLIPFSPNQPSASIALMSVPVQSEPEYGGYFRRLKAYALPSGAPGKPPPTVSGAWYLGVLKGSIAVNMACDIIRSLTNPEEELFKLDNYIGLPVRLKFYRPVGPESHPAAGVALPYAAQYEALTRVQNEFTGAQRALARSAGHGEPIQSLQAVTANYRERVINSTCPFFRMSVANYEKAAPIIWRMMVHMAEKVIDNPALLDCRAPTAASHLEEKAKEVIKLAAAEYAQYAPEDRR